MTKTDMVDVVAKKADITKKAAAAALDALIELITKDLKKGNNVVLTGFGTFRVSKRAARTGVNPRNPKEKIKIPAMKVAAFKVGKALKEAVR
jgi:DNA-binding protein HU-beta